jgi:hemolysin activation/secretion protein
MAEPLLRPLAIALIALAAAPAIHAQTPDSEEQRRRTQVQAQERIEQQAPRIDLQGGQAPEGPDTSELPAEPLCFKIDRLVFDVSSRLPPAVRSAGAHGLPQDVFHFAQLHLQRYAGQCIGREGAALIVQRLTGLILARGYTTTRVGIPEQDLSNGVLTVALVPGVIRAIRFADPAVSGSWRTAFPSRPGDLINVRDLEQGLEQMKRIASQDVDMQIVPGEHPGESDIVIDVKRAKAWKLALSLDDSGSEGTGKLQSGAIFAVDNLLGLNDLFNIGINTDGDRKGRQRGTRGNSISYSIPFGYWNFGLSGSRYRYHQQIAGHNQSFSSSGDSDTLEVKIQYLFQRDSTQKNSLLFRIGKRWSHAFIDDVEIAVQRRHPTFVEFGWVHKHYFGDAQLDLTAAMRQGVGWFDGQGDQPGRESGTPTFGYAVQTADAQLLIPFKAGDQRLNYTGAMRAQFTHSPLYASEQFSIGNRYTVRGFDGESVLAAERGFFLRNELALPLAGGSHSAYAGLDFGRVYGPSAQLLPGTKLAGAVLGLRGAFQKLNYELFAGWALYKPKGFYTSRPAAGFSITYQY